MSKDTDSPWKMAFLKFLNTMWEGWSLLPSYSGILNAFSKTWSSKFSIEPYFTIKPSETGHIKIKILFFQKDFFLFQYTRSLNRRYLFETLSIYLNDVSRLDILCSLKKQHHNLFYPFTDWRYFQCRCLFFIFVSG